ncbi:hypothetical protein PVAP13_5NG017500 [Panicum virgatum]|nr:hypothetical protein PVAP13_5NG017500 [Panicum virgatum]
MVDSMKRIKDLSAELQDFKEASKLLIDLVDPVVVEATEERSLLSRLQEATQKLSTYVLSTVKSYVSTALGLVKAWHVDTDLAPLSSELPLDCSDEQFGQLMKDVQPVAKKIVDTVEQQG